MSEKEPLDARPDADAPILVGTDFSEGAAAALREARTLSERLGARVEVLHVLGAGGPPREGCPGDWLRSVGLKSTELVTCAGEPWVQIVRRAAEISAALVVVGSHGASGLQTLGPGSTTARLLGQSPVPVVVVPPRTFHSQSKRMTR